MLSHKAQVEIPRIDIFSVRQNVYSKKDVNVRIVEIWGEFYDAYYRPDIVERDIPSATLHVYRLEEEMADGLLISQFQAEPNALRLFHLYHMMQKQGCGQEGDLLVDGKRNIFHISTADGGLWDTICFWNKTHNGWSLAAWKTGLPEIKWEKGNNVISQKLITTL